MASLKSCKIWMDGVRFSDQKILKKLLKGKFDINTTFEKERTGLMVASILGNVDVVKFLLRAKSYMKVVREKGEVSTYVVVNGCLVDLQDNEGNTALILACKANNSQVVKVLIGNRADLDIKGDNGYTALIFAIKQNNTDVALLLIQSGCNINASYDGLSPLAHAIIQSNYEIVEALVNKGCDLDAKFGTLGHTAIVPAIINNEKNIVLKLINSGCSITTVCDIYGETLLVMAMLKFDPNHEIILALVNAGCDLESAPPGGLSPLLMACSHDNNQIFEALLKAGANVNAEGPDGITAALLLVRRNDLDKLNLLLSTGKVIISRSIILEAYHCFIESGEYSLIRVLLMAGASCVGILSRVKCKLIKRRCRNSRACSCLVHMATDRNDDGLMKVLVKQNESFDFGSPCIFDGLTPLMIACVKGHHRIIKLLVDVGVDVNQHVVDQNSRMAAIHYAAIKGDVHSVQILTEGGAIISCAKYSGITKWSLLHFASKFGHKELATYIVNQMEYNPNAKNGRGETPLDLSLDNYHGDITPILIQAGGKAVEMKPLCTIEENDQVLNLVRDAKAETFKAPLSERHPPDSVISQVSSSQPSLPSTSLSIDQPYKMKEPIGLAIIINNNVFEESSGFDNRDGSLVDLENVVQTLSMFGIQTHVYQDLTQDQMVACFDHYSGLDLGQFSCLLGFVMSHGKRGHVYGIDGYSVPIINLTMKFKANRCRSFKGRPKGFMIVACQSDEQGSTQIRKDDLIPVEEEDYLVGYSTTPGSPSYRSIHGTPYIHFLMDNLRKYAERRSVSEILRNTNKHVRDVTHQPCVWFSTLLKKFQLKLNKTSRRDMVSITRFNKELTVNEVVTPIQASEDEMTEVKEAMAGAEGGIEGVCPSAIDVSDPIEMDDDTIRCPSDAMDIANLGDLEDYM